MNTSTAMIDDFVSNTVYTGIPLIVGGLEPFFLTIFFLLFILGVYFKYIRKGLGRAAGLRH